MRFNRPFARRLARAAMLAALVGTACAESDPALSEAHVAAAKELAGDDLKSALRHCSEIGKSFTPDRTRTHENLSRVIGLGDPRPYSVFDNLHFLGTSFVTAWAIQTSDGIILYDTLNNADEARDYIEAGLKRLDLDPADIEKIVISHAHGDHYGGANYLKEKYGAEIILSEIDWKELEKPELQFDDVLWGRPPVRDVSVNDGDVVTLGDTSVKILVTPGHTPGTIAAVVPLKDGDSTHKAIIWGGNGLNFGPLADRFVMMMDSAQRLGDMAEEEGFDVFLSNHRSLDDTYEKIDAMEAAEEGDPNPFVIGAPAVKRVMGVLRHCVAAQLASFDPAAVPTD